MNNAKTHENSLSSLLPCHGGKLKTNQQQQKNPNRGGFENDVCLGLFFLNKPYRIIWFWNPYACITNKKNSNKPLCLSKLQILGRSNTASKNLSYK